MPRPPRGKSSGSTRDDNARRAGIADPTGLPHPGQRHYGSANGLALRRPCRGMTMYSFLHRCADGLARGMAYLGGVVLIALVLLTCVSIAGRALVPFRIGPGPVKGIYDMTEIGIAAAVFAFLPWCQLNREHARVDLLKPAFPAGANRLLDLLFDIAMLAVAGVGSWRLYLGMLDKMRYGETTLIAQIPVWQGYLASLVGGCAFALVAAFCVLRSARILAGVEGREGSDVRL